MAASFASRLSGLREKKMPPSESQEGQLRLTMPSDPSERSAYEPSSTFSNTRTSFRLLKGRIEKGQSTEKQEVGTGNGYNEVRNTAVGQKLSLPEEPKTELKLVLKDEPLLEDKKTLNQPPKIPLQKRILIAKEEPKKEEPPRREESKREEPPPPPKIEKTPSTQIIPALDEKPIREEEAEESLPPESENDLVMCPEGCGRKFNRKALEKHAKACKLVFMSKRKEFNSQAKRISKQQAAITKQTKIEEKKKMAATKGKGFDKMKTGENWKAASEDFRAAVKAMKKEEREEEDEEEGIQVIEAEKLEDKKVVTVLCEYCEKKFNEVFIEKHLENCTRKKEKEREKDKKKTTKK